MCGLHHSIVNVACWKQAAANEHRRKKASAPRRRQPAAARAVRIN